METDPKSAQPLITPTVATVIELNVADSKKNSKFDDDEGNNNNEMGAISFKNSVESFKKSVEPLKKETPGRSRYLGFVYTFLSINMFALTSTILKKYSHLHPFNIAVWSAPGGMMTILTVLLYAICWEKKNVGEGLFPLRDHKKDLFFLWLRAVLSSIITYLTIHAFQYVSAADVRTVISASVIAVYIFSWMFLGEKCGVVPVFVAFVALLGIGIMARPPALTGAKEFDTRTLIGIVLAFSAMIVVAMNLVIIRYLSRIHHGVTNIFVYIWGMGQGTLLAYLFNALSVPTGQEIIGLTGSGVCVALGLAFLVLALQLEEAGVVALIRTSEVIFVFFWQWVIVGTYPDLISIVGASIVIFGVIAVTLRKFVENLPNDNPWRRNLAFLLV